MNGFNASNFRARIRVRVRVSGRVECNYINKGVHGIKVRIWIRARL